MKKIAVVTDSNSGITKEDAKELGVYVIPMPFKIGEEEYFEGVNITQEEYYEKVDESVSVMTSQPSTGVVLDLWEELLQEYDEIVHIPMSSGLSGSTQTAKMLSADFDGRVEVVDNKRIAVTLRRSCIEAVNLIKAGKSAAEIREILEATGSESSIYIMLDTLTYLKRGGRITPAAAAIGTMLKLKPVLQIQGDKLDAFAKARTAAQGKSIMIKAIQNDIEKRFGGMDAKDVYIEMAYSGNDTELLAFREEVKEAFPDFGEIHYDALSLSVGCHIGPGAIAITATRKLKI
ncbi:MAG: DegV family protein [Lachnospiraceae bacterium]|nr:DegV family protein [Lachnospiraceae bacterium]